MRRLMQRHRGRLETHTSRVMNGSGKIQRNVQAFSNAAKAWPQIVVVDLDRRPCAPTMIQNWVGNQPLHRHCLFRVAVREIEAWLLGDRDGFSRYAGVSRNLVPAYPEDCDDPKRDLIQLIRRTRNRELREAVVPKQGAQIGPDYNAPLVEFVRTVWSPRRAAIACDSLRRTRVRLQELANEPWP